jgi:hypothetical protein
MSANQSSPEHPGAECLEAAFGIQEQWRLEAVEELNRQRGDRWWETPFEPEWKPPPKRGGRLMCERGHVSRDPRDRCVAKVRTADRKGNGVWGDCGLPVTVEPETVRCAKCDRGLIIDGWCSSCGHHVGTQVGGDCWICGVPRAMHWGPVFGHVWSATKPPELEGEES